jgi:hypothetical protein
MLAPFFKSRSALPTLALFCVVGVAGAQKVSITVTDVVPRGFSNEIDQNSEPMVAVDHSDPTRLALSAFVSPHDVCPGDRAGLFVSTDGGTNWSITCIIPGDDFQYGLDDITIDFAGKPGVLYAGILRHPGAMLLNVLSAPRVEDSAVMRVLGTATDRDQPFIRAFAPTSGAQPRVFVGNNDWTTANWAHSAAVDLSLDVSVTQPEFFDDHIERRDASPIDLAPTRIDIANDGTVYATFFHLHKFTGFSSIADVMILRDDRGGVGATRFGELVAGDGIIGTPIVSAVRIPSSDSGPLLGQERIGADLALAVDHGNSKTVYVAWADDGGSAGYVLHLRRSTDGGATWSGDLVARPYAKNPAIAVNAVGQVAFLYQQLARGDDGKQHWQSIVELSRDAMASTERYVLADALADVPPASELPYLGDYLNMTSVANKFYGTFSSSNDPVCSHFPSGVRFLRNADFARGQLLGVDGRTSVAISIDPFFFVLDPDATNPRDATCPGAPPAKR